MSTTSLDETATAQAAAPATEAPAATAQPAALGAAVRTFRGRTLEELLPRIREDLGPDAIVVRQRDGLMGGIGGFFQQRFVEIDATSAAAPAPDRPRIDVYDEQPATPESFAQLLAEAEDHADPIVTAAAFAPRQDPPAATPDLHTTGFTQAFADRLQADARAHELPFTQGDEREALRRALARRIPTALPHRAGGLAVAFAGAGSTAAADALATAYVRAGRRAHAVATIEQARACLERAAPDALLALDLPPLPEDPAGVEQLARQLATVELDDTLLVVPATGCAADGELPALHERLAPLALTGLVLACEGAADDAPPPLGAALELACTTRLPIAYVLDRAADGGTRIAPADPTALAERLLP